MIDGQNFSLGLYCILSVLADDDVIELELSDLIEGGWVKKRCCTINRARESHCVERGEI